MEETLDDKERADAMDYEPDTRMADITNSYMRDGLPDSLYNFNF